MNNEKNARARARYRTVGTYLLAFLALCSAAFAQGLDSESHHAVIVFLLTDQVDESSAAFAQRLHTGVDFDASLDFPIGAQATVRLPPLPDGLSPLPDSPRNLLSRYVTLYYPAARDIRGIVERLINDRRFGYVGQVAKGGVSVVPIEDFYLPFFFPSNPESQQWAYQQLGLESAWDYTKGHATIGVADTGIELGHPDLQQNYRPHHSWDFPGNDPDPTAVGTFRGHGTHVAGILAADTNNDVGVAGSCWNCSLMFTKALATDHRVNAFTWLAGNGAQVVSLSGFVNGPTSGAFPAGTPCSTTPIPNRHPFCPMLDILQDREIVFPVSSGNDIRRINFPANEPTTIAVGGTERSAEIWDDRDGPTGCADLTNAAFGPLFQCGSNFGPEQDFAAPARQVLSTFFHGFQWNAPAGCSDDPLIPNSFDLSGSTPTLGYDYCTGTSMSAPFMAGVFAQLRSVNPLLTIADAKQALIETSSQAGSHNDFFGFGIPNTAAAVEQVLGTVGGQQIQTRMTPMFSLFTSVATNYLYTSKPQVASGAVAGTLHELPTSATVIPYGSASAGSAVAGFSAFPLEPSIPSPTPVSSFSVFGSDHNPFDAATPLVPLYRLSFTELCDPRDHVYTTEQAGIDLFTGADGQIPDWCPGQPGNQVFRLDGIEGYIFSECPPGFACNNPQDPAQPQCLHRRSSQVDFGHALVLEQELGLPPYQTYTGIIGNSCIGYVFPNDDSDGDGLIDGFELVLGTDRLSADSDCDGVSDGVEYPLAGLPASDPLDGSCNTPLAFGTATIDERLRVVPLTGFTNPIVVMGPPSFIGTQPTTVRVRNLTAARFSHNIQEWDYLDVNHVNESIGYLVLEAGSSNLGGLQAEAGSRSVTHGWTTVTFSQPFASAPVVVTQVSSFNDPSAVTTRVRNVTATSFQVRLQEEEAADGIHAAETVHFIAIETGITTVAGNQLVVGTSGNLVTHAFFTIGFGTSVSSPAFIADMQTTDGGNVATLRYQSLGSASATVKVEEEQSLDAEINHTTENVGYIVLGN